MNRLFVCRILVILLSSYQSGTEQYLASDRMKDRTDLKAAVIVFIGKNKYRIFEP